MALRQLFLLLITAFILSLPAKGQVADSSCCAEPVKEQTADPMKVVNDFIYDLADPNIALDVILSKHVLITKSDDELLDYLIASLQEIRLNLMSKNLNDIQFLNYRDLPRKETADIDPEGKNTAYMFFLRHRTRQVVALYVDQGKIASFTLVSKGRNKAHFVTY